MKDPLSDLASGRLPDQRIREHIMTYYKARGKKALEIVDQNRVKRYRDFFVVTGDTARYIVEDEYCSCSDFLHRGGNCAHILAVKIARAVGGYSLEDTWYYENMDNVRKDSETNSD
jgi:predicted nucleic acid-binding Zn finger protein